MESKIIPYVKDQTGQWSIPESLMSGIFNEMHRLKLDGTVFVNGTVVNHLQWIMFCQHQSNVVNIVGNEKQIEGVTWLNSFGYNYAFGHFCFFPSTWNKNSVDLGKQVLAYWFNDLRTENWALDVIMGQVPASNKRAIDYTKKIGMIELGTVPGIRYQNQGAAEGSYFCWLTREVHNGR